MSVAFKAGLEDVVAATSAICTVDGQAGRLIYRGYDINDLATNASYEEVVYLLWHGDLPNRAQLDELKAQFAAVDALPAPIRDLLPQLPRSARPLDVLRSAVSVLGLHDPDAESNAPDANLRKSVRLTVQVPTIVAAWHRVRNGLDPLRPRADLGLAANFLYQLFGQPPTDVAARTMDLVLVLHADHEFNASTFAARVVAGTEADLHAAITAAIAALKGPKHGGANEDVIAMLQEIGSVENAVPWTEAKLAWRATLSKEERQSPKARIPGFGHRVYKVNDPRSYHLRRMAQQLTAEAGYGDWFEMAERVRSVVQRETSLPVNVDFYSALVYYSLGIPTDLNTSIFAVGRISGWTAHVMEQLAHNRLIRPRAEYIGPLDRRFVPLDQR